MFNFIFFFFSSRRRHTRLTCDWSSDVCSSDLTVPAANTLPSLEVVLEKAEYVPIPATVPTMPITRTDRSALRVLLLTGAPFARTHESRESESPSSSRCGRSPGVSPVRSRDGYLRIPGDR